MGKYFVIFGSILLSLFAIFLLLSYVSPFNNQNQEEKQQSPTQASLYFKPDAISASCLSSQHTIPIFLSSDSGVNNAQIELSFNPELIYNVFISPSVDNFFGSQNDYKVTLQEVREQNGRASLSIQLNPDQTEKTGNKAVATLSFTINSLAASTSSQISFLNRSSVSSSSTEGSILTASVPLNVNCLEELRRTNRPSIPQNLTP